MLSEQLKQLRIAAGYSQYSFAEAIGVSQSAVASWESGVRLPKFATLKKLADFFNISVDCLMGRQTGEVFTETASPICVTDEVAIIIKGRDGKTSVRHYTHEQMRIIYKILEAIDEESDPNL